MNKIIYKRFTFYKKINLHYDDINMRSTYIDFD